MNQYQYIIDDYTIDTSNLLGKGACGSVFSATKKGDPIQYCAKIIQGAQITSEREMKILQFLQTKQNENIVNVYYCNIWEEKDYIVIIMEKCDSDLEKEQKSRPNQKYTENEAINIMKQLFNGYKILFQSSVIHRDIKPANILVQQGKYKISEQERFMKKMKSYGILQKLEHPYLKLLNYNRIINGDKIQERENTKSAHKVDIYSFGMLFYLLLTGTYPFSLNNQAISEFINKINYQPFKVDPSFGISYRIANLIERMMLYSPIERISFEDICNQYQEFSTRIGTIYNVKDFHFIPFKPPQISFNPKITFVPPQKPIVDWLQNFRQLFNERCCENESVVQIYHKYCDGLLVLAQNVIEQTNQSPQQFQQYVERLQTNFKFDIQVTFPINFQNKSFYLLEFVRIIDRQFYNKVFKYDGAKQYSEQHLRLMYILWKLQNKQYNLPFKVINQAQNSTEVVDYSQFKTCCQTDFTINKIELKNFLDANY